MSTKLLCASLLIATFLFSCNSRPSDEEISKRILYQYTCAETANVVSLKIVDSKEIDNDLGGKVVEYTVSGAVRWPNGCNEFGTSIPAGHTVPFENKTILFAKTEEGWQ